MGASEMINWYSDLSIKQRVIIWVAVLLASAFPLIGWIFVAPWAIPLMLFLEFQHESVNKKRRQVDADPAKSRISQAHYERSPDPRFLGNFLSANLLELSFGFDDVRIAKFVEDLPSELRDITEFWIRIYLAWIFKVYTHKRYGTEFTETMMIQVKDDMAKAGTLIDGLKELGPAIGFWFERIDDATKHIGERINGHEVPFEVLVALRFLLLDSGSPFFQCSDADTDMAELDVAAALASAKDEALPFIQRSVDLGGPLE